MKTEIIIRGSILDNPEPAEWLMAQIAALLAEAGATEKGRGR